MKPLLLCLHGWGGSKESFTELRAALEPIDIEVLTPNLPGFGDEPEPQEAWHTEDYAKWIKQWMLDRFPESELRERKFAVLGHSHGGRIAIHLAARKMLPISHLYLCAAAGVRRPRHFKRIVGLTLARSGQFFLAIPGLRLLRPMGRKFLYTLIRVHDYERASPLMQQTLVHVTAEDLRPLVARITLPTDIFWGQNDGMTPIRDGILMHKLIVGSTFHSYPQTRHAVHRDRAPEIATVLSRTFIHQK
jgi:pimeloyl-ACP methyl ester carboxylesterase